jgi:hypothetical protein
MPGRAFQRVDRVSRLLFHWTARDLSLVPRTGQVPVFSRASDGSAVDHRGRLRMLVHSQPRFEMVDLDGDGIRETPAILLEGSRTNSLLRSEEFDNATWAKNLLTVTANAAVAPDGATTADKLKPDATSSNQHHISQAATITAGEKVSWSVFLAAAEYSGCKLVTQDGSGNGYQSSFNLATGALGTLNESFGTGSIIGRAIEKVSGGYRCRIFGTIAPAATSASCHVYAFQTGAQADAQTAFAGDGSSGIYAWGAQLERAAFGSSYIKTVAAAVTRSPEIFTASYLRKPATDLTVLTRIARPVHADVTGTLGVNPSLFCIGSGSGGSSQIRMVMLTTARQFHSYIDTTGTDASTSANIPAGNELAVAWQFQDLGSAGKTRIDVGSGYGAFSSPLASSIAAWHEQKVRFGAYTGTEELFGALLEVKVAAGLYSRAQMQEMS